MRIKGLLWALGLAVGVAAPLPADGRDDALWFAKVLQRQNYQCYCPPASLTVKGAMDIVQAYVHARGAGPMTEADVCAALSRVYPCSVGLSTTVASLEDGRSGRFHSFNIQTQGDLAPTRALGCMDLAAVGAMDSPVDLFNAAVVCAKSGDYDRAAGLVTVGTIFGKYDAARVRDKTAQDAIVVLRMNLAAKLDRAQVKGVEAALQAHLHSASFAPGLCRQLAQQGPPRYRPDYMIQHGMNAFRGGTPGGELVEPFDGQKAWSKDFGDYLFCSATALPAPAAEATPARAAPVEPGHGAAGAAARGEEALDRLPVHWGDPLAAVQAAYHTHQAAAPDEIPKEAYAQMPGGERLYAQARARNRGKTLLHLQGRGLWFFFDGDGRLAEIRFDRPFAGSVAGVRLGDTQAQVRANLGRPLDLPGSRGLIPQSFYDVRPGLRAHYLFGLRDGVAAMFLMPSHGLPPPRPAVPAAAPDESEAAPPSASPAAAALAAPVQTLWKDGRGWSWDDRAVTVQADLGGGLTAMDRGAAPGGDGALHLAADAPCPQGCDADVLRLVLPAAVDVAAYLPKGHIRFDASLAQPMIGTLVVWYGQGKPCNHVSVPLGALHVGAFSHVNISLSAFHHSCGQNPAVTVPFHLTLKQVHYKAGPVLALKSIRWTPD